VVARKQDRLDSLFEIALVLLGILSAAEFQYEQVLYPSASSFFFKIATLPFIILILLWIAKELLKEWDRFGLYMGLTQLCWTLWSMTFWLYMVILFNLTTANFAPLPFLSLTVILLLSFVMVISISITYRKVYKNEAYFQGGKWLIVLGVSILVSYFLIRVIL
jgi:hypothetical protein